MVAELDRAMLQQALRVAPRLKGNFPVFINILPAALYDPLLTPTSALRLLDEVQLPPERIVFEISERQVVRDPELLTHHIRALRRYGIRFAIDDVGSGYSGLDRIAALEPDFLKVDRALIVDVDHRPVQRAVLSAVVNLAAGIAARTIAEGIETEGEANAVHQIGFESGQGYFFSRPMPLD
jgi:EAL domain-containing protein (putative c-di-GMP-specific phosphodiesterase class I)